VSREAEKKAESFSLMWRYLHPALSWAVGAGLFIYTTLSGQINQSPEWYALIGTLIGGPFVTLWKERKRQSESGGG
jgi:hypothetical protein